jgi:galactose mutarotase-like enzyme
MKGPEMLSIASDGLSARIATIGAELQDLTDASGQRLQWGGDPAVWAGRAPILFPIVGELADGHYRLDGRLYPMGRHGFARRASFDVVSHDEVSAVLRLAANDATRAVYPFEFTFDVAFTLSAATLTVAATVANRGDTPMPASIGFHPAFRWPLPFGQPRDEHVIRFAHDEPEPVRRLGVDGLLKREGFPTPIERDTLVLRDDLFVDDALILDRLVSRCVTYGASAGPKIEMSFDDFTTLGVWTKPGAEFICIEPWQGVADPAGFQGELRDKPGIVIVEPGSSRRFAMAIALV